jgi:hypothetical protein
MPFDGTAHVLSRPKRRGWFTVQPAMYLEARKLTALLVLCTSAALVASACGDDGGATGSGSGGGGTTGATGSSTGTGAEDPCAETPVGCFDAALCFTAPPTNVSLRNDLLPILQRSCGLTSACHANPASPTTSEGYRPHLGVKPSEGESDIPAILAAIVEVESWGDPSKVVVAPGDWQASYFMNKLDGALDQCGDLDCLDCGRLMPQGLPKPLPLEERNLFRAWIAEGAQDN